MWPGGIARDAPQNICEPRNSSLAKVKNKSGLHTGGLSLQSAQRLLEENAPSTHHDGFLCDGPAACQSIAFQLCIHFNVESVSASSSGPSNVRSSYTIAA